MTGASYIALECSVLGKAGEGGAPSLSVVHTFEKPQLSALDSYRCLEWLMKMKLRKKQEKEKRG